MARRSAELRVKMVWRSQLVRFVLSQLRRLNGRAFLNGWARPKTVDWMIRLASLVTGLALDEPVFVGTFNHAIV